MKGTGLVGIWRDTAIVPPYGYLAIKQCYDAGVTPPGSEQFVHFGGKFAFHCHLRTHEDTGLIRNMMFAAAEEVVDESTPNTTTPAEVVDESTTASSGRARYCVGSTVLMFILSLTAFAVL